MKIIFTIACLYFSLISYCQVSIDWIKQSPTDQSAGAIVADAAGNTYAVGIRNSATYITKRDKAGNTTWERSGSSSSLEGIVNVFIDPAGNLLVTGFQYYNTINGIVATSVMVRKFTSTGDSVYRRIVPGLFTFLDGGDIEHPGNNQTKISSVTDAAGNVYFGTAGEVGNGKGFQLIKITNSGTVSVIKAQHFNRDTTGNPFFLARSIAIKNNRVGLTGTTDRTLSNTCTWVLDTSGNTIWTNVTAKMAGTDLLFDDALNVVVLAQGSNLINENTYTGGDIALLKFDKAGKKQSSKAYDFGNNEMAIKFALTSNKQFVIMARADGTSSLYFLDWFTIRIGSNGQVLWTNRYNASNYDEMPKEMVLDSAGNVYITGIGGPDTGEFLYGMYGVTIKYSPSGEQLWKSLIHLYNFWPVDMALGGDNSVFVLSAPFSTVARLLQTSKANSCGVPSALRTTSITSSSAILVWKKVPDAFLYYVQYKTATATEWTQVTTDSNHYSLQGLQQGTSYNFRVQTVCAVGPSNFSDAVAFKTTGTGYCASKGPNNNCQWIEGVQLGAINTYGSGPNNGYKDFTNLSATITQGGTYTITTNKYNLCGSLEAWSIWIDYNHDGDFDEANELVVRYNNNYNYDYHDFTVPGNVLTGTTRMRVSMKAGNVYSTPCEMLPDGEVEDYTVNIVPSAKNNNAVAMATKNNLPGLTIYPSPAKDYLNINTGKQDDVTVQIYNSYGRQVLTRQISRGTVKLYIGMLPAGLYIVTSAGSSARFIKE